MNELDELVVKLAQSCGDLGLRSDVKRAAIAAPREIAPLMGTIIELCPDLAAELARDDSIDLSLCDPTVVRTLVDKGEFSAREWFHVRMRIWPGQYGTSIYRFDEEVGF